MKTGLVQAAAGCDVQASLDAVRKYARAAAQEACDAVCFPECFLTGYMPEAAAQKAVSADSESVLQLSGIAAEYGIDILAGFMERDGSAYYITHGIFRRDGSRDFYRKTHPGRREQQFFTPGGSLPVFSLSCGVKIGFQLCVETHYPEITQTLALRGAQLVFAPHAVPRVSGDRQAIWNKYIPARSYDNRVYMACCNLLDERFGGGCLVTGPRGESCAACFEDAPALLCCELDLETLASFRNPGESRSRHFYPALRRRELFD